jgi:hypothetical protein
LASLAGAAAGQTPPNAVPATGTYGSTATVGSAGVNPNWANVPLAPASAAHLRSSPEMSMLYLTAAAYGVGMGVELSAELRITDPGLFLIAPALLGVAAPGGAWALDQPRMHKGVPAAISTGILIGAGEGLGIAGTQMVTARSADAWGFRGLSRATAIGATAGAIGGYFGGTWLEPPPNTSLAVLSGIIWGTAIGSMFAYGASPGSYNYGRANDWAAVGGLIGYNAGALAAAGLGTATLLSDRQLGWMWAGAGIGAAVSLPVFLFYAGDGGPPARRGLVFTGTATTLGLVAGALFAAGDSSVARVGNDRVVASEQPALSVEGVVPWFNVGGVGVTAFGSLF